MAQAKEHKHYCGYCGKYFQCELGTNCSIEVYVCERCQNVFFTDPVMGNKRYGGAKR